MKTIIFSPAAYNLAETTRALEIAKACRNLFDILFVSYGGRFENLIEKEGFRIINLEPKLTPKNIRHIYGVDQGYEFGYYFSIKDVKEQVKNEISLFKKIKPAAVVTGFNFSNSISCRVEKVPLIWLTQSTWMLESYSNAGLAACPDRMDYPIFRWLPENILSWIFYKKFIPIFNFLAHPYDVVAKKYGIKPFKSMEKLWEGDYNLLPEPEEFCGLKLPSTYHYIGPLIGRLDSPIPQEILQMEKNKPIIYFAMGSSGQPKIIAKIIQSFTGKPFQVISPSKSLLQNMNIEIPSNVILTDWLPAHKVNPLADISVIHGGIGTVMTACLAGTPIVGIAMQPEQEANLDCIVRKGFAIRIKRKRLNPDNLIEAINKLLTDEDAHKKAKEFQKIVQKWNDLTIVTNFFKKHINNSIC